MISMNYHIDQAVTARGLGTHTIQDLKRLIGSRDRILRNGKIAFEAYLRQYADFGVKGVSAPSWSVFVSARPKWIRYHGKIEKSVGRMTLDTKKRLKRFNLRVLGRQISGHIEFSGSPDELPDFMWSLPAQNASPDVRVTESMSTVEIDLELFGKRYIECGIKRDDEVSHLRRLDEQARIVSQTYCLAGVPPKVLEKGHDHCEFFGSALLAKDEVASTLRYFCRPNFIERGLTAVTIQTSNVEGYYYIVLRGTNVQPTKMNVRDATRFWNNFGYGDFTAMPDVLERRLNELASPIFRCPTAYETRGPIALFLNCFDMHVMLEDGLEVQEQYYVAMDVLTRVAVEGFVKRAAPVIRFEIYNKLICLAADVDRTVNGIHVNRNRMFLLREFASYVFSLIYVQLPNVEGEVEFEAPGDVVQLAPSKPVKFSEMSLAQWEQYLDGTYRDRANHIDFEREIRPTHRVQPERLYAGELFAHLTANAELKGSARKFEPWSFAYDAGVKKRFYQGAVACLSLAICSLVPPARHHETYVLVSLSIRGFRTEKARERILKSDPMMIIRSSQTRAKVVRSYRSGKGWMKLDQPEHFTFPTPDRADDAFQGIDGIVAQARALEAKRKEEEKAAPIEECRHWVKGKCRFGRKCNKLHGGKEPIIQPPSPPCHRGNECYLRVCRYSHPLDEELLRQPSETKSREYADTAWLTRDTRKFITEEELKGSGRGWRCTPHYNRKIGFNVTRALETAPGRVASNQLKTYSRMLGHCLVAGAGIGAAPTIRKDANMIVKVISVSIEHTLRSTEGKSPGTTLAFTRYLDLLRAKLNDYARDGDMSALPSFEDYTLDPSSQNGRTPIGRN
jgi:hypothetical protein